MREMLILLACALPACGDSVPSPKSPVPPVAAHWSYSGDDGPSRWGELDPTFAACKTGSAQSPIDLPPQPQRRGTAPAKPHWDPVPLKVTNNGHAIQIDDSAPSSFVLDGTTFKLAQFHFHSPAEHTIGGHTYAAEMHLVHKSDAGKTLVVAILFESGAENAILGPLWKAIPEKAGGPANVAAGAPIDVSSLLPSAPRYLRYDGSLTVPPCTEGVTWLVVEPDPSTQMSAEQAKLLHDRTQPTTNRPLQPLGTREVVELSP
jgi:carbonic anhydrase